jgi:hypothetical protein
MRSKPYLKSELKVEPKLFKLGVLADGSPDYFQGKILTLQIRAVTREEIRRLASFERKCEEYLQGTRMLISKPHE